MSFAVYTEGSSNDVYKDGHKMFNSDVVKELNRKSYLEEKILQSGEAPHQQTIPAEALREIADLEQECNSFISNEDMQRIGSRLGNLRRQLQVS